MSDLVEIKVNLIPKAWEALENAAAMNGDTKTDTVNRALQMYYLITMELMTGAKIYMQRNGEMAELKLDTGREQ